MAMRITRQLMDGKPVEELSLTEQSDLVDELENTNQNIIFLKMGLETSLKKMSHIHRDLKRSGQNVVALELHSEMQFVGRLIATLDILLLPENYMSPLEELFDT